MYSRNLGLKKIKNPLKKIYELFLSYVFEAQCFVQDSCVLCFLSI